MIIALEPVARLVRPGIERNQWIADTVSDCIVSASPAAAAGAPGSDADHRLAAQQIIKVRLARNFAWRKDGPIQRFFMERIQQQLLETTFSHAGALRIVAFGASSRCSNELMQQRLHKVANIISKNERGRYGSHAWSLPRSPLDQISGHYALVETDARGRGLVVCQRASSSGHDAPDRETLGPSD